MRDINIFFTLEEKISLLEHHGFEINKELRKCYRSVYHNDVEEFEQMMYIVYKDGKEFIESYKNIRSVSPEYPVDEAFEQIVKKVVNRLLFETKIIFDV